VTGASRYLALLAGGSAAFTAFGSLVPFDFRDRPDAVAAFAQAMTRPLVPVSRSDAVVNVLLGVPLGFALLGAACGGRPVPVPRASRLGLALLPGCALFSAAVEFAQLYTPTRFCSGLDVIAQTIGAAVGMVGWVACGPWLLGEVGKAVGGTGTARRLLVAYVLFLGFVQALPLDFSASPADAYRKFRDGQVGGVPFGEFRSLTGTDVARRIATLLELGALYLPVGLLAAAVPGRCGGRGNFLGVLLGGLALAVGVELGQVVVRSRTSQATDVVVGTAAVVLGWLLGKAFRHGLNPRATVLLGAAWWAVAVGVSWSPFVVEPGVRVPFDWTPGRPLDGGNPLLALEAMLNKVVLFGLGGAVLAASTSVVAGRGKSRPAVASATVVAVVSGLLASAVLEWGQTWFVGRSPGLTDVVLGGLGGYGGAWLTETVRTLDRSGAEIGAGIGTKIGTKIGTEIGRGAIR